MNQLLAENKALKEKVLLQEQLIKSQQEQSIKQEQKLQSLQQELAQLKKMVFGSKRERFIGNEDPNQLALFKNVESDQQIKEPEPITKQIKVKQKPKSKIVARNTFPEHLKRETETIEPTDVDLSKFKKIGEDVTEILKYTPASLLVKKIIRPKYISIGSDVSIHQAGIPDRLIPKGMVDQSLVVGLLTEKILFHTPVHRFNKKLKQAGVKFISDTNLYNWFHRGAESLLPLYHLLKQDLLSQPYIQVDETTIKVLSKNKPGATHRGYMWVINSPKLKSVLFEYHPSRSTKAAEALLEDFEGTIQSDGYNVYKSLSKKMKFILILCMAHARRMFVDAQDSDPPRAAYFLERVQVLYELERLARDKEYNDQQRFTLRQEKAVPVLKELGIWLKEQYTSGEILPKSLIGKAVAYSLERWDELSAYAEDGSLEIDNNLIENTIRPLALGRKNYLFAGSNAAAQNLACLYSIIGTAQLNNLNVFDYLNDLFTKVVNQKVTKEALNWLPHRMSEEELVKFRT